MAATIAPSAGPERFTRQDLENVINPAKFKAFCKYKCGHCNDPATQRFKSSMPFVVKQMIETFWCPECGRVLCEPHRYQHTCERLDQQKERNAKITHEALAAQIAEAEARKEALEEEEKMAQRVEAEARDAQIRQRKDKRKVMAQKAKLVEDFIQAMSRDTEANAARGPRARDELFELYSRAKRLSLTLYNEYDAPSTVDLPDEDYNSVKEVYKRATEITHMFASVDGQPLDLRNPWDPPPPADADDSAQNP